jgi:hypothetical protein
MGLVGGLALFHQVEPQRGHFVLRFLFRVGQHRLQLASGLQFAH